MNDAVKSYSKKLAELVALWHIASISDTSEEEISLPDFLQLTNKEFVSWGLNELTDENIYKIYSSRCKYSPGNTGDTD